MGNKLYVGNLPYSFRDDDLQQAFAAHGTVTSAKVMMERDTGRSKGFGFVEMADDAQAQTAIEAMNGQQFGGRGLVVNEAEAFGAAGVTFHHDFGAGDGTVSCECLLQIIITERIWHIPDVQCVAHEITPQNNSKLDGVHNRNQQTSKDLRSRRETDIHRKPCTVLKTIRAA
jgi:RNA recognition motif-containing protein